MKVVEGGGWQLRSVQEGSCRGCCWLVALQPQLVAHGGGKESSAGGGWGGARHSPRPEL